VGVENATEQAHLNLRDTAAPRLYASFRWRTSWCLGQHEHVAVLSYLANLFAVIEANRIDYEAV
jgi:hypothetical protein